MSTIRSIFSIIYIVLEEIFFALVAGVLIISALTAIFNPFDEEL